jgi:hypothetical protein
MSKMKVLLAMAMVLSLPQMISGQLEAKIFQFFNGTQYLNINNKLAQAYYVAGVLDGFSYAFVDNPKIQAWLTTHFEGKKPDQISAVVNKFLKENPEDWHYQMGGLVIGALREWYPPRKTP